MSVIAIPRRILLHAFASTVSLAVPVLAADGVEFCATVAEPRIPLGTHTHVEYYLWNRSSGPIEYYLPEPLVPVRHYRAPQGHETPRFSMLQPGQFVLRAFRVPREHGFTPDLAGKHTVRVQAQLRRDGTQEVLQELVHYELSPEPPPERFVVKNDWAWQPGTLGKKVLVSVLDDSEYRLATGPRPTLSDARPYRWNMDAYFNQLREWYEQPGARLGFGEPDDWTHDFSVTSGHRLFHELRCLLEGCYILTEFEYRIRHEIQFEVREKFGLSPYYAVNHAIWILREQGKAPALAYLKGLDTAGWNCVDTALRSYTEEQIAAWKGTEKPRGLVYSEELRKHLVLDRERDCLVPASDSRPASQ